MRRTFLTDRGLRCFFDNSGRCKGRERRRRKGAGEDRRGGWSREGGRREGGDADSGGGRSREGGCWSRKGGDDSRGGDDCGGGRTREGGRREGGDEGIHHSGDARLDQKLHACEEATNNSDVVLWKLDVILIGMEYRFVQSLEDFRIGAAVENFVDVFAATRSTRGSGINDRATVD